MSDRFQAEEFGRLDKWVNVRGPVSFIIDNDDVGPGNELLVPHLVTILNKHWTPLFAWYCDNEDCERVGYYVQQENHDHDGICFYCKKDMEWREVDA